MSLATYNDLIAALASWLDHSLYAARYPDFIALFEAAANRKLKVRQMEKLVILVPDNTGAVAVPADFSGFRRLTWTGSPRTDISYTHPSYFQAAYPSAPADVPRIFTIEGFTLKIMPISQTSLEFEYFAGLTALSAANQTNWMMTQHPDAYLFGSLAEAETFGVNDERMGMWKARRDEVLQEIETQDMGRSAPAYIRVFGVTP